MPVAPIEPIVIPAKTLDKFWIKRIEINSPNINGEASAQVSMTAYNDNGETDNNTTYLEISQIMQKAMANPDSNIAKAMHFLLLSIDEEYKSQVGE